MSKSVTFFGYWVAKNVLRVIPALVAIGLLLPAAPAAQAAQSPLDVLSAYRGTWTSTIVHYKTKYSKARSETTTVRNDCWRSGAFYACDQIVKGESAALVVYTYDVRKAAYVTHAILKDGGPANPGALIIKRNVWTYPWQDKDGNTTVYLRIVNEFSDAKTIKYRQEFSLDRAHWTLTAKGIEHRVAG